MCAPVVTEVCNEVPRQQCSNVEDQICESSLEFQCVPKDRRICLEIPVSTVKKEVFESVSKMKG